MRHVRVVGGLAVAGGRYLGVFLALVAANAAVAVMIGRGHPGLALAAVLVPILGWLGIRIAVEHRHWLVFVTLAIAVFGGPLGGRLPGTGGTAIYPSDLLVVLAVASWTVARLALPPSQRPAWPRTPVLSWPLVLFGIALLIGVVRGHERYGAPYLSQPTRTLIYALVAGAFAGMSVRTAYRGVVVVMYAGTALQSLLGLYHLATGTSQTTSVYLSTGGTRTLALSTAMFLAGGFVLALLNLEIDRSGRRRRLHFGIAALAFFGIAIALGRTTFVALSVVVPLLFLGLAHMRRTVLVYVPLLAPVAALLVLLLVHMSPSLGTTLRVNNDPALVQRERKYNAVLKGFGADEMFGLGFGRTVSFTNIDGTRASFSGDPENSFIYLLAGGGIFLLGSFLLLVLAFFFDAFRRVLHSKGEERALILFGLAFAFILLVNALTFPLVGAPPLVASLWIAMLLPAVVVPDRASESHLSGLTSLLQRGTSEGVTGST